MPLFVGGEQVPKMADFSKNLMSNQSLRASAEQLKNLPMETIDKNVLFVFQREFACISATKTDDIEVIGTDDATTCHIVVLQHPASGVTSLGHFDGTCCEQFVRDIVAETISAARGGPDGRLELHLVGGFVDEKQSSMKITKQLLSQFHQSKEDLVLQTLCVSELNDCVKDGVHFPVIYGLGVNVKTGKLFPAKFPVKSPAAEIRGCLAFAGYRKVHNIYNIERKEVVVGPYTWQPWPDVELYLNLPKPFIRKYLSTSPQQEPDDFEDHVYSSLQTLRDHPFPHLTLFPDGQPLRYHLQNGQWTKVG